MKCNLVIELGGGYVTIFKAGAGLVLKQPALVALKKYGDGYKVEAVGQEAKLIESIEDENIRVFSPFSGGKIKNLQYGQIILKEFARKINIKGFLIKNNAVIVTDVNFTYQDRQDYKKLLSSIGVKPVFFIPSLFGVLYNDYEEKLAKQTFAVLDIGATHSTFGLIFDGREILAASSIDMGGKNMSLAVKEKVKKMYNLNISFFAAETLKEALGNLTTFDSSTKKVKGVDASSGQERIQVVKAQEIKEALLPFFEKIAKLIEFKLNQASDEQLKQIKENGIIVSGQVAKVIGLERYLKEKLSVPVTICNQVENSGVLGIAKQLNNLYLLKKTSFDIEN